MIETLHASETQAAAPGGSWYLVRIRPYRTARNTVEGVVITFVDITDAKRTERLQAARVLAESIVDAVREPFLVLDGGAPRRAGEPRLLSGVPGRAGADRGAADRRSRKPSVDHPDAARAPGAGPARGHELRRLRGGSRVPQGRPASMLLNARQVVHPGEHSPDWILLAFEDATDPHPRPSSSEGLRP